MPRSFREVKTCGARLKMRSLLGSRSFVRYLVRSHVAAQAPVRAQRFASTCRAASSRLTDKTRGATEPTREQKEKLLESAMEGINGRFGAGSIMKLGQKPMKVESVPTGALTLDIALGGGFPKGRIVEIFGPESSGKTTLALHAIAAVQRSGGIAALIDAEHAFDPIYSKRMGLDVENLVMCQPDNGEMALEAVDQLIRSSAVDIIVVDSVAALTPRAELEGEIGAVQVGAQARLMSQALRKLSGIAAKCNILVIFINQLRMKIGVMYGNPEVTTGGNALKFYSSVRLDVRRIKTLEEAKEQVGIKVRAKVVKNKCAPPFKMCEFDIMFGSGISTLGCLLDAAERLGVVVRKGGWYSYEDKNIGQGREKIIQSLRENPELASDIEAKTRERLLASDMNDIVDARPAGLGAAGLGAAAFDDDEALPDELDLEEEEVVA